VLLKPCPFCEKPIPRAITVCPYCRRDEQGRSVQIDSGAPAAAEALKELDKDIQELGRPDPFVRDQALARIVRRGTPAVAALTSLLSELEKPGLAEVAKALGRLGDARAIPALTQAARTGNDELRTAAVWALAQFREPGILPILLSEAERPHPALQAYLAYVLGGYPDERVVALLAKLSRRGSREVVFQAACALGETGHPRAAAALQRIRRGSDPAARAAAASALKKLGVSAASPFKRWIYGGGFLTAAAGAAAAWRFFYR